MYGFAIEPTTQTIDDWPNTADKRRDRCKGAFSDARQHFALCCYSIIPHEIQKFRIFFQRSGALFRLEPPYTCTP